MSFQGGIASVALITTALVLLTACVAFVLQQWDGERRAMAAHHRALAEVVAEHARDGMVDGRVVESEALVRSLADAPNVRSAFLLGANGETVAAHGSHGPQPDRPPAPDDDAPQIRAALHGADGRPLGELVIVSDGRGLLPIVSRYLAVSATLFFAATGLAIFLSQWFAARLIRPVESLSRVMTDLGDGGDPTRRAPAVSDPVFGPLTDSFNGLMDKLQAGERALRHTNRELTVARDAAEAANVLKSQFLANMSHEIRTPLNGVLAMAQIMEMSGLEPKQRERLKVIRQSGEALLAVLNDVLDLSKIEAGRLELVVEDFDLGRLARELAAGAAPLAAGKGLEFRLEPAPEAEGLRRGDAARLKQIAGNLLSNAVKFTSEGSVALAVEGLGVGGAEGIALTVRDTGVGVPADKLPTLFDKFVQADNSATREFGGTGLGLAICRELATLMGGRIGVVSEVGRGSTFRVELPFPRAGETIAPAAPEPAHSAGLEASAERRPVRILAAEDNPTNQRVLRAVLDTFGVELTLVENGRLAVQAWERGGYDLVLMDIQMPEMDGVEATRAIRTAERERGLPRTPVLALSANAMTHQVAEYLAAGLDAHVAKPIEVPKLQAALAAALDSSAQARAA